MNNLIGKRRKKHCGHTLNALQKMKLRFASSILNPLGMIKGRSESITLLKFERYCNSTH